MTDGQRPGLVGADDVHPAQGLDRARVPHQRAAARKTAGGAELRDGRQQRQPFGHGGDRKAHSRADRLPQRASPQHADRDDGGARPQRHRNGERGERTQTGFNAAGGRRPTEQHAAAGLGRVADRDDHACGLAGGDRRALVDHGRPLRDEGGVGRRGVLRHGNGLAGEARLVHLEWAAADDPAVGRHGLARLQADHVSHDEIVGAHIPVSAAASDAHGALSPPDEGGDGAIGPQTLRAADDRVQHHHAADHRRVTK